ncbi:hypothetical protein ACWKSP_30640 [Micromonosporaceae bacterium Da 78-11]
MPAETPTGQAWLSPSPSVGGLPARTGVQLGASGGGLAARYQPVARPEQHLPPVRPEPTSVPPVPGVAPVVVITFFFGIFGAIPAALRARRARALDAPDRVYWVAFAATLAASWVLGIGAFVAAVLIGGSA